MLAYVVGKPIGIFAGTWAASRGRDFSAAELGGTALSAGVGFTVSPLIAARALHGVELEQAKVGILVTAVLAPVLATAVLRQRARPVAATPCPAR